MSHMTIGKKLMLSFGAVLAVTLGLGIASLQAIGKLSSSLDESVNKAAKKLDLSFTLDVATSDMLAGQRGVLVYGYAKSPAGIAKAAELFQSAAARCDRATQEIRPLLLTDEGKRLTSELETTVASWRSALNEMRRLADSGDAEGALRIGTEKGIPLYEATTRSSQRLEQQQKEMLEQSRQAAVELNSTSRWTAIGLIGLALAVGVVAVFIVRGSSRTLQRAAAELGESAEQVASASSQVSSSSQALAQGASEQAASIEETSASSEEITSMTRKNADNSKTAADLMAQTNQVVKEANHTLGQMETSMREINAASDKVGKIIKVIDEIAFQTNILALNAAVEAARAGEAGMGFAVVADEVRNLAQRSAQAAKDTASLIEESITKSNEGRAKVDQVATAIRAITDSAQKVRTLVDEVKLGSEEQARGIEQISKAISQMEQVTQKAAANAEETASAGEEMSAQATTLNSIVERLRALVGGSSGENHQARRRPQLHHATLPGARPGHGGSTPTDLHALHGAIGASGGVMGKEPAHASAGSAKATIPLDDDFKEF
jgi:methyl-accepting chemotaxis protein